MKVWLEIIGLIIFSLIGIALYFTFIGIIYCMLMLVALSPFYLIYLFFSGGW